MIAGSGAISVGTARMAIGADRSSVLRMVLRQGLVLAAAGLTVGLSASIAAGRALAIVFPGGVVGDSNADFGRPSF